MEVSKLIREELLQQNAFHEVDRYCPLSKASDLIELVFDFKEHAQKALENNVPIKDIVETKAKYRISSVRMEKDYKVMLNQVKEEIKKEMDDLMRKYS